MLMSVERAERIGPTGLASFDWKIAASRVMPPSTCSSKTVSASIRPAWGRASGALSILMISATRPRIAGSPTGMPVSGAVGAAGGAVVVGSSLVGGTEGTLLALSAGSLCLPPQLASARAARRSTVVKRRRMMRSELLRRPWTAAQRTGPNEQRGAEPALPVGGAEHLRRPRMGRAKHVSELLRRPWTAAPRTGPNEQRGAEPASPVGGAGHLRRPRMGRAKHV